jgi:putative solute:sodium symporter small subunit
MNEENQYRISFFKPTTERAIMNRNLTLWLVSIWAVAIFGFHFTMRAIEKPTPEPELVSFNEVWEAVKANEATDAQIKQFALSALHVTGKVFIDADHRAALDNGISWAIMQIADSAQQVALTDAIVNFESAQAEMELVTDSAYVAAKMKLKGIAEAIIGLPSNAVLATILPLELKSAESSVFTDENKTTVKAAMPFYMIHNRSVLTDTKFLGFPFHYFYTAVFLLILFIVLCYAYCYRIDKYDAKMEIAE